MSLTNECGESAWEADNRVVATIARAYSAADKQAKGAMLDELCSRTGWHRAHARRVLRAAIARDGADSPAVSRRKYGSDAVELLSRCWTLLDMPSGKRLVPALPAVTAALVRHGYLAPGTAALRQVNEMSPATVDRALADERARSTHPTVCPTHAQVMADLPIRRLASPSETPGQIEMSLRRCDARLPIATLTGTATATRWTVYRSFDCDQEFAVESALTSIAHELPCAMDAITATGDDDRLVERIGQWCTARGIEFFARPDGTKRRGSDVAHRISHDGSVVSAVTLLNAIWRSREVLINNFYPHQFGAHGRVTTATPWEMIRSSPQIADEDKAIFADEHDHADPVQLNRFLTSALVGDGRLSEQTYAPLVAAGRR